MNERSVVDFLAIGPPKTGTTWMDHALRQHPMIHLPAGLKETHYFDEHFERGSVWYEARFPNRVGNVIRGEVAPSLFHCPGAAARVARQAPGIQLLVTLRHPVERARSQFEHHWSKGRVRCRFGEAIHLQPDILEAGRYRKWIERWEEEGFSERITCLFNEDMRESPEWIWERVQTVLGLTPHPFPDSVRAAVYGSQAPLFPIVARAADCISRSLRRSGCHGLLKMARRLRLNRVYSGGVPAPPMNKDETEFVLNEFRDDVAYVERLTGRNLGDWTRRPER